MKNTTLHNKLTEYNSFFLTPDYLEASSAWIEHIPFAFWIVEVLRPKVIVELGVHTGTSYFAFCQAVRQMHVDTTCYGVDTWEGDEHTGFYGNEVYERVRDHNQKQFAGFSTLIKSTFDEAKEYFIDGSVDVLHVDGFHTYEAVKHDFESWLPKVSNTGLVIFHDTNVRERNFGVFRLWEELKSKYPNVQFDFGCGLGILAIGKILQNELKELFEKNNAGYCSFLRNIFSERGNFFKVNFHNELRIQEQISDIHRLTEMNAQLSGHHKPLELHIAELAGSHKTLEFHIDKLNESHRTLELHIEKLEQSHRILEDEKTQLQKIYNELEVASDRLRGDYARLESAYSQLQEKNMNDVTDLSKKIKEAESSLNNLSNELLIARKENEVFRKHISWYKETYEDRNLLGVLKEKIKRGLRKNSKNGSANQGAE
jgi:hypothetical protein